MEGSSLARRCTAQVPSPPLSPSSHSRGSSHLLPRLVCEKCSPCGHTSQPTGCRTQHLHASLFCCLRGPRDARAGQSEPGGGRGRRGAGGAEARGAEAQRQDKPPAWAGGIKLGESAPGGFREVVDLTGARFPAGSPRVLHGRAAAATLLATEARGRMHSLKSTLTAAIAKGGELDDAGLLSLLDTPTDGGEGLEATAAQLCDAIVAAPSEQCPLLADLLQSAGAKVQPSTQSMIDNLEVVLARLHEFSARAYAAQKPEAAANAVILACQIKERFSTKMIPFIEQLGMKKAQRLIKRKSSRFNRLDPAVFNSMVELAAEARHSEIFSNLLGSDFFAPTPAAPSHKAKKKRKQAETALSDTGSDSDAGDPAAPKKGKKNKAGKPLCFNCGKRGHKAPQCDQPIKRPTKMDKKGKSSE